MSAAVGARVGAPLALALLLALAPAAAAGQACLGQPLEGARATLAGRYAHFEAARGLGVEGAVRVSGPLDAAARVARRGFDDGSTLLTGRVDLAYEFRAGKATLCPTAGLARESLDVLDITLIPLGVGLTAPVAAGSATLWPYVVPGIVHSRAAFPGQRRITTDPDLRVGATLSTGRLLVGAGWERRFTDGVDGAPFVRVGFAL